MCFDIKHRSLYYSVRPTSMYKLYEYGYRIKKYVYNHRGKTEFLQPPVCFIIAAVPISHSLTLKDARNSLVSREPDKGTQWRPTQCSRICSDHFIEDDYVEGTRIKKLKSTSVPTRFPTYPLHKEPAVKKKKKNTQGSS